MVTSVCTAQQDMVVFESRVCRKKVYAGLEGPKIGYDVAATILNRLSELLVAPSEGTALHVT